ncbi:MAG: FG-GAP repeat domain-containing protein, partial [Verrucomicrobiales bacterium]
MAYHKKVQNIVSGWHYKISEKVGTQIKKTEDSEINSLFNQIDGALGIKFNHSENFYDDFKTQPLLPNRLSRYGPALAIGDIDGDGDKDVFLGAARDRESAIFIQNNSNEFERVACPALKADQIHEDVDAVWFDFENDGDQDLYVVSGGASQPSEHEDYQDRLYLNDGSGQLIRSSKGILPEFKFSGSRVAAKDFDNDGDLDLFIGSRFVPGKYPTSPESVLLINENGKFSKVQCAASSSGMVTDVKWADINGDQRVDLVLATEWGPVRVYENKEDGFKEITKSIGLNEFTGWWNCVLAADIDQDGDIDILAGNFGTNTKYSASKKKPATLFASDFGDTGALQLVEAQFKEGKLLPIRGRSCSTTAMPHLLKRVPT